MVPEAIRMMDEGSFQLMIDRLQEQLERNVEQLEEQAEQLGKQAEQIEAQAEQIEAQAEQIEARAGQLRKWLVDSVDNTMQNFRVDLHTACAGLGVTVEQYEAARKVLQK